MKNKIIIMLIFLLTASCYIYPLSARRRGSADNQPEWLTNPGSRYPQEMYLVAIGEGDSRSRAEANAAANLARVFETKVETEELFNERYQEIVSGNSFSAQSTTDIDKTIALSASQTLYNIQFADSYTDNLGKVHVLAYIQRSQTADIYMEKISNHNEQIKFFLEKYNQSSNNLHRYAYVSVASVISTANEVLLEQLNIISVHYRDLINLDYNHNDLLYQTRSTAQNIAFRITLENDKDNKVSSVLADMLTGKGFVVSQNGAIPITGTIDIENVDLNRPEKFVRWHLTLNVFDPNGSNIVTHSQRGREGHVNQPEAVARAFRAMERDIHSDFNRKLFKYFDNLVK